MSILEQKKELMLELEQMKGRIESFQVKLENSLYEREKVTIVSSGLIDGQMGVLLSDGKILTGIQSINVYQNVGEFARTEISIYHPSSR